MSDGHYCGRDMAAFLVTYIADDRRVRQAVLREFRMAPTLAEIREMRERHDRHVAWVRRGREAPGCENKGWDPYGHGYRAEMEVASAKFLAAIVRERGRRRAHA